MNDETRKTEAIEAVLRWHLPETLRLAQPDTPSCDRHCYSAADVTHQNSLPAAPGLCSHSAAS